MTKISKEKIDEWENLLSETIIANVPTESEVSGAKGLSEPICKEPGDMINYFLYSHRPKIIRTLELLDNYINKKGILLDVGSWISAFGLFFYLKCKVKSESISVDCNKWELKGITKNIRRNLCNYNLEKDKYDVVCQAEMFGHYPGNIHRVIKMMVDACKTKGIIFCSVPLGVTGLDIPKDKDMDLPFANGSYAAHLREFYEDEIIKIIKKVSPKCKLLENEIVNSPAFGKIQLTVWRKK